MTDEQWENTIERIEQQFGIADRGKETLTDVEGWRAWIEFDGPQGKMKLERTVRPRLMKEQTVYAKRIGSAVTVKKVYDPDTMVSFMNAYRWNETKEDWEEVKATV